MLKQRASSLKLAGGVVAVDADDPFESLLVLD